MPVVDTNVKIELKKDEINHKPKVLRKDYERIVLKDSYRIWAFNQKEIDELNNRLISTEGGVGGEHRTLSYKTKKEEEIAIRKFDGE